MNRCPLGRQPIKFRVPYDSEYMFMRHVNLSRENHGRSRANAGSCFANAIDAHSKSAGFYAVC